MSKFGLMFAGMPGAGKTTISNLVVDQLREKSIPVVVLRLDNIVSGDQATKWAIYRSLSEECLADGRNVILDATLRDRETRNWYYELFERYGYKHKGIYLRVDRETAIERAVARGVDDEGHPIRPNEAISVINNWIAALQQGDNSDILDRNIWTIYDNDGRDFDYQLIAENVVQGLVTL